MLFKELARLAMDGYVSGMTESRRETSKISSELGDNETVKQANRTGGVITVPVRTEAAITDAAKVEARDWCNEIESRCRRVLLNFQGSGAYDAAMVGRQLGAVVRDYFEDEDEAEQFAARRMKVRNKEQHRQWQREKMPYVKYIKTQMAQDVLAGAERRAKDKALSADERRAAKTLASRLKGSDTTGRTLKKQHEAVRMRTGWNRWYNRGVVERALAIDGVAYLQWTTRRDARVCEICLPYDLWVVRKDAPEVAVYSPPLHFRCRCRWVHVTEAASEKWDIKPTRKADWPDLEGDDAPAPGFGGLPKK